jgi:outer membrane protein TolC
LLPLAAVVAGVLGEFAALPPGARAELVRPKQSLPPALNLSLEQTLELGLGQSINLRNSRLMVQENQALLGLAGSRFLPSLDLVGLGSYAQVGSSVGFISNLPTIGDLNLQLGNKGYAVVQNTFVNVGLALKYSLFDFSRGPLRQSAQAGLQASEAEQLEQRRRSRFEIVSAYLNAQLAEALIPVWQRSLKVSNQLRHDAWAIRKQGLAARIDTLQADALVQSDRQGLVEAEAQRQIALSGLARALNLPLEQGIEVERSPGARGGLAPGFTGQLAPVAAAATSPGGPAAATQGPIGSGAVGSGQPIAHGGLALGGRNQRQLAQLTGTECQPAAGYQRQIAIPTKPEQQRQFLGQFLRLGSPGQPAPTAI